MKTYLISLLFAFVLTPVMLFFEQYIFNDWPFIKTLIPLVLIDSITGFGKSIKTKTVSSRKWEKIGIKIIIYLTLLVLAHILKTFKIQGQEQAIYSYVVQAIYAFIVGREALSIIENIGVISPKSVPKKVRKYLKDFDSEDGTPLPQ